MLPKPNIKGIVSSVLFCRVFPYVHFECFGELKTRYLHIDPFTNLMIIVNIFYVWKIIIVIKCVEFYVYHLPFVFKTNFQ